jgi:hypothetical protein
MGRGRGRHDARMRDSRSDCPSVKRWINLAGCSVIAGGEGIVGETAVNMAVVERVDALLGGVGVAAGMATSYGQRIDSLR